MAYQPPPDSTPCLAVGICYTNHIMKDVTRSRRVIRVAPQHHHMAKIAAAELGIPLSQLADEALERELERRRQREKIAVASASTLPVQTRG